MSRPAVAASFRSTVLALAAALASLATGCSERPSAAQIDLWRAEAQAANAAKLDARRAVEEAGWRLAVSGTIPEDPARAAAIGGAIGDGSAGRRGVVLEWKALQALATTRVMTRSPHVPPYPDRAVAFRGVRLSTLLDALGAPADAQTVTLACADGYRVEVAVADARAAEIILAIEADGRPIPRHMGGPVYAVYPIDDDPRIKAAYTHERWAFYVTHVVVGTDAPRLRVAGKDLDAAAIAAIPQTAIETNLAYRLGWSREPTTVKGRRLRDVFAAAGRPLAHDDVVHVLGKVPVDRDAKAPHRIHGRDALGHDILVVERTGAVGTRVPASRGGPLMIAFPAALAGVYGPAEWVGFVEQLEVVRP